MLSVDEALDRINHSIVPLPSIESPIVEALGLRLAGVVHSSVDSPPFDKSMMDGFALRSADLDSLTQFDVVETLYAGSYSSTTVGAGQAVQIMTGAPIPPGTDCVIRREDAAFDQSSGLLQLQGRPSRGENIILRGSSMRSGEVVLKRGCKLNVAGVGLLAELGLSRIDLVRRPTVAILATGDELVAVDEAPGVGQIRNSNEPMLAACVAGSGGLARPLGVCKDVAADLDRAIADGLKSDILCLSGGVSAGEKDLVPAALKRAGVEEVFHKVNLKPGKPLWFGKFVRTDESACLVFGLPGNPVSSLVCFELFVRHALERLQGAEPDWRAPFTVQLSSEIRLKSDRPVYHPARLMSPANSSAEQLRPDPTQIEVLSWQGSSDLRGAVLADGVVHFPAGEQTWPVGSLVRFLPFPGRV